jgi:hypothetical protein
MLFDQSADALSFVGNHRRKQLKCEFSAAAAQTMRFDGMAHAIVQENWTVEAIPRTADSR